jgi:hypothetical protein
VELGEIASAVRRWWWLALLVPALTAVAVGYRALTAPFESTLRATVLIPGDTEIPGNAERPELMVLDDLPALIGSRVFAEAVSRRAADAGESVPSEQAQSALSGSRHSRVLTVTASHDDRSRAAAIARAAELALPDAVNEYLIAEGGQPATVRVIDPAAEAVRDRGGRLQIGLAQVVVALAAGVGLAVVVDSIFRRQTAPAQPPG